MNGADPRLAANVKRFARRDQGQDNNGAMVNPAIALKSDLGAQRRMAAGQEGEVNIAAARRVPYHPNGADRLATDPRWPGMLIGLDRRAVEDFPK